MLNTLKLKSRVIESGITVKEIAGEIGVNPATIYRKINGKSQFTADEMIKIKKMLHIDTVSFCNIFFGDELTETQETGIN